MPQGSSGWRVATLLTGAITAGTQITLLREILSAFFGNELVIGVLLFDWLALTGVGALLAHRWTARIPLTAILPVVLGALLVLPPLTFAGFRLLPLVVAPPGSMLDFWMFLAGAILVLSPVCLISGAIFSLLVRASASSPLNNPVGSVYAWEAVGSLVGGSLFGFLLFDLISSQDLLLVLCICAGSAGGIVAVRTRSWRTAAALGAGIFLLMFARYVWSVDEVTFVLRYPGHAVLEHRETPFGVLTVTRLGEQTMVFANNVPLLTSGNPSTIEETVHFALVQRYRSPAVLIAGGNPSELVPEVLKYAASSVQCIEENSWLREAEHRYLPFLRNERVEYREGDLRSFLLSAKNRYDVIILVSPEPSTLQLNRTYTREFILLAHQALRTGGVLCMLLPSSAEYAGSDARRVRSVLRCTLAEQFGKVRILPSGHDVFLASDSALRMDIAAGISEVGVSTTYVNAYYIQDDLLADRARHLDASLEKSSPINTDAHPVLMLAQLRYWLRYFDTTYWFPALAALALVAILFLRSDRITVGIVTAGCGGIVLELMALMIVQVSFGNVYKVSGLLIALYMGGMGLGAFAAGRVHVTPRWYAGLQSGLALTLLIAASLQHGVSAGSSASAAGLAVCLFAGSLSAGGVFALTSRTMEGDPVISGSRLYGSDLLGSAFGALVVGPLLLPLLGLQIAADGAAGIVAAGCVVSLTSPVWREYEKA